MGKNKGIIFNDDDLGASLEKKTGPPQQSGNENPPTVSNLNNSNNEENKTQNQFKKRQVIAPSEKIKWKRDKNPLYDMLVCVDLKYIGAGELDSIKALKGFSKAYKKYALDKGTSAKDLVNIALYQYGLKEGFIKPSTPKDASNEGK